MMVWIVTAFYVAGIVAAIDAVMNTRTAQGAIAGLSRWCRLPFVAVPAYLVLGRSKSTVCRSRTSSAGRRSTA